MNEEDERLKESEMKEKLKKIFTFLSLEKNRSYNIEIQSSFFNSVLNNKKSEKEKLISLLYFIAETQSQGSIDKLSKSYEKFHKLEEGKFKTWKDFCCSIGTQNSVGKYQFESQPFAYLFNAIKSNPGYGDKTSALFVRMIFQIHHIDKYEEYKLWDDVPKLEEDDILFLPVDKVITEIFKEIPHPNPKRKNWTFNSINKTLNEKYSGSDMEIWDDLWFWGFITQLGGEKREFELNKDKYWVMKESNKDPKIINEIFGEKGKAQEFLEIII